VIRFITQFSVWRTSGNSYFIVASCTRTKETALYVAERPDKVECVDPKSAMPDVRLNVPCKWAHVDFKLRCAVRAAFLLRLETKYGAEPDKFSDLIWDAENEGLVKARAHNAQGKFVAQEARA